VAPSPQSDGTDAPVGQHSGRPPGWALSGGRKKNVAIAASTPIDAETGGKGERFTPQTPEEAARLAEYNRYLEALSAEDDRAGRATGGTR
jgi:hypothetical protein